MKRLAVLLGAVGGALLLPSPALAHVATIEYRFPLPVWMYALAGAAAVLASVPAAAIAVRSERVWTSGDLYPALAWLRLGRVGLAFATALLAVALAGGFLSDELGFFNAAVVLFWVDLWVGLGIASALVGNLWDFVSPLNAAGRLLDRVLARRGIPARPYPEWLGIWPAVGLLLAFSWAELVWDDSRKPLVTALMVLIYLFLQLGAMGLFGAEAWLARGELFTVVARTFARLAPLELYVRASAEPCRAARCEEAGERVGCPACWLEAPREGRGVRLRPYGVGIRREPTLGPGGSAFVVALLATVVYDGLRTTVAYGRLTDFLTDLAPGFERAPNALGTLTMLIVVGAFALLFLAGAGLVARLERSPFEDTVSRYAPSLIPIAAVYFIAHYFLYLFYVGQLTPGVVLDPLGQGWVANYRPWTGVPGAVVWTLQAGVIVWGHVVAVITAHRISLRAKGRVRAALVSQLPLVTLMVTYTFSGLLVLGLALQGEG
ncbi:MAG: hypothetical protein ACRDL0_13815 [Thermoleophilaceae bacterium]